MPTPQQLRDAEYSPNVESGETPTVYVRFTRPGVAEAQYFAVQPTRFEYTSSLNEPQNISITVPDEALEFINHDLLRREDLKTEVEVRFGYVESRQMSDLLKFVFFRQKPNFPQQGAIDTTLTAYDHSILLSLPTVPRLIKRKDAFSVKDMVELLIEEANDVLGMRLAVHFGDGEEQEKANWTARHWRFIKPVGSPLEFLYYIRSIAERNGEKVTPIDVFVKDGVLYFRPRVWPSTYTAYYYYRDAAPGARMLSFAPEVNTTPTRHAALGAKPEIDAPVLSEHDGQTKGANDNRAGTPTVAVIDARGKNQQGRGVVLQQNAGVQKGDTKGAKDDLVEERTTRKHVVQSYETLDTIAARYGTTIEDIAKLNGLDPKHPQLPVGKQLDVPVIHLTTADAAQVSSVDTRVKAALSYLMEEAEAVKAKAVVIGDPRLEAGQKIAVFNVGINWEGPWYIETAKHVYDGNGYITELDLTRDGFPLGSGLPQKPADNIDATVVDTDAPAQAPTTSDTTRYQVTATGKNQQGKGVTAVPTPNKPAGVAAGAARVRAGKP